MSDKKPSGGFSEALGLCGIKIVKYNPVKSKPVITNIGTMDVKKFSKTIMDKLGAKITDYPSLFKAVYDIPKMTDIIERYSVKNNVIVEENGDSVIPAELADHTLNVDITAKKGMDDFFVTTKEEYKSNISGRYYIGKTSMPLPEAYRVARSVIPRYRPRNPPGVFQEFNRTTQEEENIFNSYIPPDWVVWRKKNPNRWQTLSEKPPALFMKLVTHLIPMKEERQYFYAWLYASLTKRAYVYLILCGAPGAGKNRLKLIMKALHGIENTVDGKKSTLSERFNSQLSNGTLTWFDELKYDSDMENVMKEIQNDYISIEKKGVDATTSSTIHSSMVISNNKPRDNFIAFDARKFVPLVIGSNDLKKSMTEEEISILTNKVEQANTDYDIKFVAQIVKFILRTGKRHFDNNVTLEYKGPMFWKLAHTSMTRWQKKAISFITEQGNSFTRQGWDEKEKAYVWSQLETKYSRRHGEKAMQFPDNSSVMSFFETFRDGNGKKAFKTARLPGSNILGDFYIYPLIKNIEIITEAIVMSEREKGQTDEKTKKPKRNL